MNMKQIKETARALVASDKGLQATDERDEPRNPQSSTTTKPPISKRKMAISLSLFLKKQRPFLALRRQDDGKQA
jgi:hypothetical protein